MKNLVYLSTLVFILSCAAVRPGPQVSHPDIKDHQRWVKDIVSCEKKSNKDKDLQQECLEQKGYSIVGWN